MRLEDAKMKTFRETVLMFFVFLALSGIAYADDRDKGGGLEFEARLSSAQEVPENPSEAKAKIEVEFDKGFTKLEIELKVTDTVGFITRAHFHCAKPGENGPIIFGIFDPGPFPVPMNANSLKLEGILTNADLNPGQDCVPTTGRVINNLASLAFAMREGLIYANVHTIFRSGGEVRGQMIEVIDDDKHHKFHRDDKP
jgi:CHRD domain